MVAKPRGKRGGRKVKLFQTTDATHEQIKEAPELQARLESPKYLQAVQVAQATIHRLVRVVKNRKLWFNVSYVAFIVSKYLSEEGIRVWR
jgi:hypothetical protein